ncbi:hypothetical protein, partial [Aeromonas veronii]|uniref:hypothetical protein n=1 Tax=Aeromonas veronii TaxID=654 RepID=UPI003B9DFC7F
MKRYTHDADLKRMVVIRSPSPQLVPFKRHRFGKQRQSEHFNFCSRLHCQHLNAAICCEHVGIVAAPQSGAKCQIYKIPADWRGFLLGSASSRERESTLSWP